MIDGAANRQRVLEHAFRLLRPGGKFVLHVHNRWFNLWDAQGRKWLTADLLRGLVPGAQHGDQLMPAHQGIPGLTLHLFTLGEIKGMLASAGFRIVEAMPVGLGPDGLLPRRWLCSRLRAYGYLLAARRANDV